MAAWDVDGLRLAVFGHTTMDYIVELERLPEPNTSIEMERQKRYFGGTGANIARRSARLGVETLLSSFVGSDFPEDFRNALSQDGVDLADLRLMPEYLTPMCWIMSDRDHNQIAVINQGPMRDAEQFQVTPYSIERGHIIHISTGRPGYYIKVMIEARKQGKIIGFDPAQEIHYVYNPVSFMEMLSMSDFFFCNESEFKRALEYAGEKDAEGLLHKVPVVVVTRGAKGSTIYTRDRTLDIPAVPPQEISDTTGAGDAYRAGFYAAMSRHMDLEQCGKYASASSSFAIEQTGPQEGIPAWEQLESRLKDNGFL